VRLDFTPTLLLVRNASRQPNMSEGSAPYHKYCAGTVRQIFEGRYQYLSHANIHDATDHLPTEFITIHCKDQVASVSMTEVASALRVSSRKNLRYGQNGGCIYYPQRNSFYEQIMNEINIRPLDLCFRMRRLVMDNSGKYRLCQVT
jgi:hypothetical protein